MTALTADQAHVLRMMSRAGGGWFPLRSTWALGTNQRTNRVCGELAALGLAKCVGGDPTGRFVCDWRITANGVGVLYRRAYEQTLAAKAGRR